MLKHRINKEVIIGISSFLILNCSCLNQYNAYENPFPVSNLFDSIPYDVLGQGKLVFRREVHDPDQYYSAAYIVDIDKQNRFFREDMGEPTISPDGSKIVFGLYSSYLNNSTDIYVTNTTCSHYMRVSDIGGVSPCWALDGTKVVFMLSQSFSGVKHKLLYKQSPVQSTTDRSLVIDFYNSDPAIAPVGKVQLSSNGQYLMSSNGIYTFDTNGKNLNKIIPLESDSQYYYSPVWSPDGTKIAVISLDCSKNNRIKNYSLILFNSNGSNPNILYTLSATDKGSVWTKKEYSVCWSPDGTKLAFTRPNDAGINTTANIFVIKTDHTGFTQVTNNLFAYDSCLSWGQ
jgi:Tol biopolymer transport system component